MKKKIFTLLATLWLTTSLMAQGLEFEWASSLGGFLDDEGNSITVDASGNVYTTGYFEGTVFFLTENGEFNINSNGGPDIYISKSDASGNLIWVKAMGGSTDWDVGNSIAIDASGNVYTTGIFRDTVDFDPGIGIYSLSSSGADNIFILKLDASGNFIWAKTFSGSTLSRGYSIAIDSTGNVYTTGVFTYTVDFDPGIGICNLTSNGSIDIFILKLDASGNFVWAKSMGGNFWDWGHSIAIDASGNVYTTGNFLETVDFDPGSGVYNLSSNGSYDIFISKLDSSGNFIWAKSMGGSNIDYGNSIAINASGNIYTTGFFEGTADFDPGSGTYNLSSNGIRDIFISKLDASGNFVWAKAMGDTNADDGNSIALDAIGNVYTTGIFQGTVDFDPGSGIYNLNSNGWQDIFISKLDASGNFVWAKAMGSSSSDFGYSIAIDAPGNIYTTGYFQSSADFNPGSGISYLSSNGCRDIYISKLSQYMLANFTASDTVISLGDTIQFTDLSSDNPTSWLWDFGDGTSDTLQNPTVVYNSVGMFDVELIVGNGMITDTKLIVDYITVNDTSTIGDMPNIQHPGANFELFQNIPNPFRDETEISFYLPKNCAVEIEIFNLLGERIVETLHATSLRGKPTTLHKGHHSITFNSKNLPAGTYYYRLKTEGFEQTRKMVVMKY
ncbi:MAG: SBBP repeat-containing protein [Bacteroidales bacterium]|nr:SBBP repeat-containing protein [Bacteroidales bacterium]MCF8456060.1 SBBP repeat-containing protein [Bacteroidales bacterium]